jgi:serine/threonine-protein kinase PknG
MSGDSGGPAGQPCPRDDCKDGVLDEDGFCNVCEREAPALPGPDTRTSASPAWLSARTWQSSDRSGYDDFPLALPPGIPPRPLDRAPLGLGIVPIPWVQPRDPESLLRAEHELVVDESRRRCPSRKCRAEVGRSQAGIPGQPEGRCPACGTPYSFRPQLRADEIIQGQYKVRGCIGYGGQGWVYLARDLRLDDDPVALKGQRVATSAASQAAAAAERHTLIKLRHPDIVDIRNFVTHPDPVTGEPNGYIVLEFLAGESLEEKMIRSGRLSVAEAISYMLAVLPALGYLHDNGLVYGDFKPANVMQVGNRIKLIDLGAVRRIGDAEAHLVLTPGFHAPEVGAGRPQSVSSDLYTVGRTLAVLTAPADWTTEWATGLPGPGKIPVFGKYESFYRFLCRATATSPERRFGSAAEMAGQLTGVLRETIAHDAGRQLPPAPSVYFTPERDVITMARRPEREAALALPVPQADPTDPAAAFLGTVTATDPGEVMAQLRGAPRRSLEAEFRRTLATMRNPGSTDAEIKVDVPPGADPSDWRIEWYRGIRHLAVGNVAEAWHEFARIRDLLPGELAPKLALATCAERLGDRELATHYYQTVWRTGQEFVGAAFGIARTCAGEPGDDGTEDAIETLDSVPASLRHHVAARITAMRLRLSRPGLSEKDLREAAERLRDLDLTAEQRLRLKIEIWQAARAWLADGNTPAAHDTLLGKPVTPDAIGFALERAYLSLRRHVPGRRERVALVKNAHAVRPRTRWRWSQTARGAEESR